MKIWLLWLISLAFFSSSVFANYSFQETAKLEKSFFDFMSNKSKPSDQISFPHETCFRRSAIAHKVPMSLLLAVARGESDFNPKAVSTANAIGVMQILWPGTAKHLGITKKTDLYKPCININAGAKYLRELLDRYENNAYLALAAYNYGPGRIKKGAPHNSIPKGATWYSKYIYQHLTYVATAVKTNKAAKTYQYDAGNKLNILIFHQGYRAEAFVQHLKKQEPSLDLAWFKRPFGEFHVVLQYQTIEIFR